MSTPPSPSLTDSEGSSGSTKYYSASESSIDHSSLEPNTEVGSSRLVGDGDIGQRGRDTANGIDAPFYDYSHGKMIGEKVINLGTINVTQGNSILKVETALLDGLVLNMTRSLNAEYDMIGKTRRETCAPETHEYVLKDLKRWCTQNVSVALYWLSGMPGTGKTTIVFTLCHYLHEQGLLGASFFCSQSVADCQDVLLIFPTIAFQLARKYPPFAKELASVLHADPDISRRELGVQLRQLIIEPFNARKGDLPSNLVVVLDALDECSDSHSIFLQALIDHSSQLPFRLILTSRPEHVIHDVFRTTSSLAADRFVLHEVEKDLVRQDVFKYIQYKLSDISPPPDVSTISALTDYAGSVFVLAATMVRLIMNDFGDPRERLTSLVKGLTSRKYPAVTSPLDMLYITILSRLSNDHGIFDEEIENIKTILFTIVCVREPLTKRAIAYLWNLEEAVVERRLRLLRSVIFIPENHAQPITTFHASFLDFITDKQRSGSFYCDTAVFHDKLAMLCLKTMNQNLFQDICNLNGRPPNDELDAGTTHRYIDPGLAYAAVHWVYHLSRSNTPTRDGLIKECHKFSSQHLLHWIECLSFLRCLPVCERGLGVLEATIRDKKITRIVQEIGQFVQLNYDGISYSAKETHFSALVWVPTTSPLRSIYAELWNKPTLPKVMRGLPAQWMETSRVIGTHSRKVTSVVITNDGNRVVSGSEDMTVRVWNIDSHEGEHVFTGHQGPILAVAISPTDGRIFSGASDSTVRVWEIGKPDPVLIFKEHTAVVRSISVSKNGKLACSSDLMSNVLLWDARTAKPVRPPMKGSEYSGAAESLVFMSDNIHVVYASYENVCIWNINTGAIVHTLASHQGDVECIAVSPGDARILSGGDDKTAKLWSASSGKKIRTLRGHKETVYAVAFFNDGYRAITGSKDQTIRIWNFDTGDCVLILSGHRGFVYSVAVLPDDTRVVSGSGDGTMLVWGIPKGIEKRRRKWARLGKAVPMKKGDSSSGAGRLMAASTNLMCLFQDEKTHILDSSTLIEKIALDTGTPGLYCMAISPSETYLAACSKSLAVWEIPTGRKLYTRSDSFRRSGLATAISYSHDSSLIATGSTSGNVHVCSATTGEDQFVLSVHHWTGSVCGLAFSPDSRQIAVSHSNKPAIHIWDLATRNKYRVLQAYSIVVSIVFSADATCVIGSAAHTVHVWNLQDGQLVRTYGGYSNWTSLPNGVSYAIWKSSWICRLTDPLLAPAKLCWIPQPYRSNVGPWSKIAFSSSSGDRIFLANASGLSILDVSAV